MVRTGLIALAVVLASSVAGCKSKSGSAAKKATEAEKPAPPEPRIPAGTLAVTLPKIDAKNARRVADASGFVTVAKDGAITYGKLAAGADPYAGHPHDPTRRLEDELMSGPPAARPPSPPPVPPQTTQDDPPPPEPDDPDVAPVPVDPARPQGQYKMKRPPTVDDQLARQQAIDAARNAGILGTIPADDVNIYGGLLGDTWESSTAYAVLDEKAGDVDTLIIADKDATAHAAIAALQQLAARDTALAVDGGAAPDALRLGFREQPASRPEQTAGFVTVGEDTVTVMLSGALEPVLIPRSGGRFDTAKLATALRPSPMTPVTSMVQIDLEPKATVQELAEILATLTSIGAPSVLITAMDPNSEMAGGFGFGRSGFGPGGGGTGWGTIGTGRYGTIGQGAGTGTGYGVGGGRGGTGGPKVSIGQPKADVGLDKAIIRRYIKRNIAKITYCYEKELLDKPGLEGTVKVQFFISGNGIVESSDATGVDDNVASCVAGVIKAIEFPKPKGGGGVQVNYPFTFRSTD